MNIAKSWWKIGEMSYQIQSCRNDFPLDICLVIGKLQLCFLSKAAFKVSWQWQQKLVILNFSYINNLVTREMVQGLHLLKFGNDILCLACKCGRQVRWSNLRIIDPSILQPLELIHVELCIPSTVASLHHKKYILVIVDDYTISHGFSL